MAIEKQEMTAPSLEQINEYTKLITRLVHEYRLALTSKNELVLQLSKSSKKIAELESKLLDVKQHEAKLAENKSTLDIESLIRENEDLKNSLNVLNKKIFDFESTKAEYASISSAIQDIACILEIKKANRNMLNLILVSKDKIKKMCKGN